MQASQGEIRIIGIGSHHGIDQLGWLLCAQLSRLPWPEHMTFHQCPSPAHLPGLLQACDKAILIDAIITGSVNADIIQLTDKQLIGHAHRIRSSHGFGLREAVDLARSLGPCATTIELFAVTAKDKEQQLSELCRSALPHLQTLVNQVCSAGSEARAALLK